MAADTRRRHDFERRGKRALDGAALSRRRTITNLHALRVAAPYRPSLPCQAHQCLVYQVGKQMVVVRIVCFAHRAARRRWEAPRRGPG